MPLSSAAEPRLVARILASGAGIGATLDPRPSGVNYVRVYDFAN